MHSKGTKEETLHGPTIATKRSTVCYLYFWECAVITYM